MQWRGRRTSSNVEDRRGRGGMGRPAGIGGLGLVVVLLIGVFFGVDVTPFLGGGGGLVQNEAPSGPNRIDDESEAFVATVLAGTEAWFWIVGGAGLATLLLGAYAAMFQNDLKGLLAYSTISHLGLITLLLGLNSPLAAVAAVFHMMNHATFKASLFMSVGIIDHESGTRDMRRLEGLYRFMPVTGTLAIVACAAMAGVPLLNGFLSKEMFFAETVFVSASPAVEFGLPALATLAGVFAVVYSLRFGHDVFFGPPPTDCPRQPHEPVHWMRVPVELLVLACIVVGTLPAWSSVTCRKRSDTRNSFSKRLRPSPPWWVMLVTMRNRVTLCSVLRTLMRA